MTVAADVDMSAERLFQISWGLVYKCVCAPAAWDADRVSDEATRATAVAARIRSPRL
jgi:hypothetical protein